jgi:hypothetical protein
MKVLKTYEDGSQTIKYEKGDRIQFVGKLDHWLIKIGDLGFVWNDEKDMHVDIRTDNMILNNWGIHSVPTWELEIVTEKPEGKILFYTCPDKGIITCQHNISKQIIKLKKEFTPRNTKIRCGYPEYMFWYVDRPFDKAIYQYEALCKFTPISIEET